MNILIEKVDPVDTEKIRKLLKSCDLPVEDLSENNFEHFFMIKKDSEIAGTVGLEIYDNKGLLRSLAVKKECRSYGFGQKLVQKIERYAQESGIKEMYLLTTTADQFFAKRGYDEITRDKVPDSIQQSEEFAKICPSTAIAMKKIL